MFEFRRPNATPSTEKSVQEGFFPPCIYSNASYTKGIRVFSDIVEKGDMCQANIQSDYFHVPPRRKGAKKQAETSRLPVLSPKDSSMWMSKFAATSAVRSCFPMEVLRNLGSITRTIVETRDASTKRTMGGPFGFIPPMKKVRRRQQAKVFGKPLTRGTAKMEARLEVERGELDAAKVDDRVEEIMRDWTCPSKTLKRQKQWDEHGSLKREPMNDDDYVPVDVLLKWMTQQRNFLVDLHANAKKSLYRDGLCDIPVDTISILEALLEMSDPTGLYDIPLLVAYPVVTCEEEVTSSTTQESVTSTRKKKRKLVSTVTRRTWKIRIGVYASRLLPEVMSCGLLRDIMAALDPESYRLLQPLHLPPQPKEPVFDSSPHPVVVLDDDELHRASSTVDMDEEEKKSERDATFGQESTRDESRISAFTAKGLLKLFENRGNDVSIWKKEIEPKILPKLKMDLLLHQQHAICWMAQMESLGGFGINSILWEEREFLDGGKYYYAPALGQLRLGRPPVMKGGLLCDEMGMGKTVEVMGLILATLDDLKQEAKMSGEGETHATLIIVPPALVSQWLAEIQKATGDALVTSFFDYKTVSYEPKGSKEGDPDIVITTYPALETRAASRELSSCRWSRIVLDEMQEIRSSTTKIAKACTNLQSNRRWMLSGTPLFDGIDDLRGELNFLHLEPYAAKLEDGFFRFSITNHWENHSIHAIETLRILGLFVLRRSKSMTVRATGAPLLGLKPLTVEFAPIPQSDSERALYCFLEFVVSRELRTDRSGAKENASRRLCLRLLRELCTSAVLLNGGMGVASQLKSLNRLLIAHARREAGAVLAACGDETSAEGLHRLPVMSCDEAIRHLCQVQESVRTGENEVAFLQLGFGQGMARRIRAADSVEQQLQEAEESIQKSCSENKSLVKRKAKALWHLALEKVTTGELFGTSPKVPTEANFRCLWQWRRLIKDTLETNMHGTSRPLPSLLRRGWRPSCDFLKHADPISLQFKGIPKVVTVTELSKALSQVLADPDDGEHDLIETRMRVDVVNAESLKWNAIVIFSEERDARAILHKASTAHGISLPSKQVDEEGIKAAKAKVDDALAALSVQPTELNRRKFTKAKRECERGRLGLRIVHRNHKHETGNVVASPACRPPRSLAPASCQTLCDTASAAIADCRSKMAQNLAVIARGEEKVRRFRPVMEKGVSEDVRAMSAFDSLQALSNGEPEETQCPICLGGLGTSRNFGDEATVAMIKCGHLFCRDCLRQYVGDCIARHRRGQCPSCRTFFDSTKDVVRVDPSRKEDQEAAIARRQQAKRLVEDASRMLAECHGVLDPEMWEQLFLAIDTPEGANRSLDARVSSIPRDVLAHLRNCTGMPVHCGRSDKPVEQNGVTRSSHYSTKVKALLADLPRDERSVVFSSSNATIKHLLFVLEAEGIGSRALFTGQHTSASEKALTEWQSSTVEECGRDKIPYPVLLVQAGAAASGLTLTAACKMFLMEPFVRHEEEQQAYARCHRYGQTKPVHCKCYYSPVSVESRLLEWRRRAVNEGTAAASPSNTASLNPHIVYSSIPIDSSDGESEDDDGLDKDGNDHHEETDQTLFLLGLNNADTVVEG